MRRLIILLLATLTLCGCVPTTMKISEDLPKSSKVSAVAVYQNKAIFFKKGYAGIGDSTYFHTIPNLHMNDTVVTTLNRQLKTQGHYNVVYLPRARLESSVATESEVISSGDKLSKYMIRYIKWVMNGKPVDYIVLVKPGIYTYDTSVGQTTIHNRLHNFGVVERNILGVKWAFVYGSYKYYVINTHNWTVLGSTSGRFDQKVNRNVVKNEYREIPGKMIGQVRESLRSQVKTAVRSASNSVGLI